MYALGTNSYDNCRHKKIDCFFKFNNYNNNTVLVKLRQ